MDKILHCFADQGIECEVLSGYGELTRVGLDPVDNPYTDRIIQSDARELELDETFDLGLFHPPCQPFSTASRGRNDDDNLIPLARELAKEYCENYIIENVPQAPLHDPIELHGGMFGLPLHYKRAFETSYHVNQPFDQSRLGQGNGPFQQHHENGDWTGSVDLWRSVKGYSGSYDTRSLKREAIPRAYINYLVRPLL